MYDRVFEALSQAITSSPSPEATAQQPKRSGPSGMDRVCQVLSESRSRERVATVGDFIDYFAARLAEREGRQAHRDQQPRRPVTVLSLALKEAQQALSESRPRRPGRQSVRLTEVMGGGAP